MKLDGKQDSTPQHIDRKSEKARAKLDVPYITSARLISATYKTDPKTGGPLPLRLVIDIPGYAASAHTVTELSRGHLPVVITIEAIQPPLPFLDTPTGEAPE